ncbi:cytochrome c-type biogenesis protein CcmH [Legionella londiniensis]|uniref:Cytochrome c-type biogenesis protein n=2 Tax=Legionella londiniensis TaxID=45068 RepID=A0A0W0VM29_9GAMM|nr:cytochrome c-type biogenesis protein CcmH [Legionella londiniensis]STX93227.1 cytochrome c-type biogenesis protein CcmH [Legionella londiniensis]
MIALLMLLGSLNFHCYASSLYPFETKQQDAQFQHLLHELRCLVCQNQDLADSNAPLAKDLRDEVYQLVKSGKTDNEIIHFLTERYGEFVLFKPPLKTVTMLLWFGPFIFALLGLLIVWRTFARRTTNA